MLWDPEEGHCHLGSCCLSAPKLNFCSLLYEFRAGTLQTAFLACQVSCVGMANKQLNPSCLFPVYFLFVDFWTSYISSPGILSPFLFQQLNTVCKFLKLTKIGSPTSGPTTASSWQSLHRPGPSLRRPFLQAQPTLPSMVFLCQRVYSLLISTISPFLQL